MTAKRIFPFLILVACSFLTFSSSSPVQREEAQVTLTNSAKPVEGVKCKNEQGKDVDWFIVYKLPKNRTSRNELVREGLAYAYILPNEELEREEKHHSSQVKVEVNIRISGDDVTNAQSKNGMRKEKGPFYKGHGRNIHYDNLGNSHDHDKDSTIKSQWILSEKGIHSPESMVGLSIARIYQKNNQDVAFLTYNDQPPVGPTVDTGGHSKGIILVDSASGFWLQHSIPHFPLVLSSALNYTYPTTGKNNGQVVHCISLPSTKDVDDLARIFEITKPHVVNFSFPTDSLKQALPQLSQIVKDHHRSSHLERVNSAETNPFHDDDDNDDNIASCANEIDEERCLIKRLNSHDLSRKRNWDQVEIRSANGRVLQAFAKGPTFNEDIYSSQLAPFYKTSLKVQSWLNGPHPFVSNCTSSSYSVYNIQYKSIAGHEFSTHNDHSKWALSTKQEQPVICISDLNRMEHQLKRGGVAVCFTDSQIWLTFNKSIIDVQPCPRLPTVLLNATTVQEGLAKDFPSATATITATITTLVPVTESTEVIMMQDNDKDRTSHQPNEKNHTSRLRKVINRAYSFVQNMIQSLLKP